MAQPIDMYLTPFSGDFLSQNDDNLHIESMDTWETPSANIIKERVTLEDGTKREVTSTHAKQRAIDIGIIATAAWLTHDKGMNQAYANIAAEAGIDTVFMSPPLNLDRVSRFGKNVCDMITIADYMHVRANRDPDHLWVDGKSQGAMYALGITAQAPQLSNGKKKVIMGDYIAGCFPEGLNLKRDLATLPQLIVNECNAATTLMQLPLAMLKTHPRTLAFHPRMQLAHLNQVPALLSGEVGTAAKSMPADTFGHVTNYRGDILGQGRRWEPILSDYDNLTVENIHGAHLSLVAKRCEEKWETRTRAVRDVIRDNPRIVDLGGAAMRHAVAEISSSFRHRK